MPYIEHRGGSIRVKWWGGEYLLDADGKPAKKKYESASGPEPGVKFADEQEAWNFGLDREHEVRHGNYIRKADGKTLMRDYCKSWIDGLDLRTNSVKGYRTKINARILPQWGAHAVGDITPWEYDGWRKSLRAEVARGKLGKTHCDQVLSLFGTLMADAVKYKLRAESPVVIQRRRGRYEKKKREKKRPFQMETLHALAVNAHAVWGYTGWVYIWTIAFTGIRPPGEITGLRREYASPAWPTGEPDAELREEALERYREMPALRVQWQLQYEDGKRELVEPKYQSERTLVLPPFLHEMHTALLASHTSPWMFPALGGEAMGSQFPKRYWKPIRDGADARNARADFARPKIAPVAAMAGKRQYLMRHWHKEMLDEDGHSLIAVETRMGHEVAGVQGLYANLTPKMERDIVDSLQARWQAFMGPEQGRWQPDFPNPLPVDHQTEK